MLDKIKTLKEVVDWIDKDMVEHSIAFPGNSNVFVNGAMTALKNLKSFIDLPPTNESNQDVLWDEMYVALDSMAVDVDPYEYGLPTYNPKRQSIIDNLKLRYTLTRK